MIAYFGADISSTHAAFVGLDVDGRVVYTDGYTIKKNEPVTIARLPVERPKKATKAEDQQYQLDLLAAIYGYFRDRVGPTLRDNLIQTPGPLIVIEDYAFGGASYQHAIAQVGGLFRAFVQVVTMRTARIRLHPPGTVGLYACDSTKAEKLDARTALLASPFEVDAGYGTVPNDSQGDLTDAYVLARIGFLEDKVRAGRLTLDALTDGQRRVFLRTTDAYPENLLCRPFLR